jgi:periplasmic divalent cation tolerance protein
VQGARSPVYGEDDECPSNSRFEGPFSIPIGIKYPMRPAESSVASPDMSADILIAFCTCPDAAVADRIAEALVGEQLAACASILPGVASVYRWEGQMQRDVEVLLLIKTTRGRLPELTDRVRGLHPYELPEVIAVPVTGGLPDYLQWVIKCTASNA